MNKIFNGKQKVVLIFTVICALITIFNASLKYLLEIYLFYIRNTNSGDTKIVGTIGGADGPTSILVTSSENTLLITVIFTLLTIMGISYLVVTRVKHNKGLGREK